VISITGDFGVTAAACAAASMAEATWHASANAAHRTPSRTLAPLRRKWKYYNVTFQCYNVA
jgi:hypothetical protein